MNKGGRGHKAPYNTYIARIPLPLKTAIDRLISRWITLVLEEESLGSGYVAEIEKAISDNRKEEIRRTLLEGLNCPKNNSRLAKEAIRKALQLMEGEGHED